MQASGVFALRVPRPNLKRVVGWRATALACLVTHFGMNLGRTRLDAGICLSPCEPFIQLPGLHIAALRQGKPSGLSAFLTAVVAAPRDVGRLLPICSVALLACSPWLSNHSSASAGAPCTEESTTLGHPSMSGRKQTVRQEARYGSYCASQQGCNSLRKRRPWLRKGTKPFASNCESKPLYISCILNTVRT